MNILYIACSCSPYYGSEDKIGWSIPVMSARDNNVFVVTFEKNRKGIEKYLSQNPIKNIDFYYVDIPNTYKKIFSGFFFSGRLNIWHKRACKLVKSICKKKNIDIIHQITPVEFRSIGNYGKIKGVKFVCGPIAGGQSVPRELKSYTKGHREVEIIRKAVNCWYKLKYKVNRRISKCDYLLFANHETSDYLDDIKSKNTHYRVVTDVAIDKSFIATEDKNEINEKRKFLVAGRLVYLKGHEFLFDALKNIPKELDYECRIVGEGPELEKLRKKCADYSLEDKVIFAGAVPYAEMEKEYKNSDALIMPSFREATGSVLLEAISKGLPIITINKYGGATILNDDSGWLYEGNSKEEYIENLKNAIISCITRPDELLRKGKNARKISENYIWENKMALYQSLYEKVLGEN